MPLTDYIPDSFEKTEGSNNAKIFEFLDTQINDGLPVQKMKESITNLLTPRIVPDVLGDATHPLHHYITTFFRGAGVDVNIGFGRLPNSFFSALFSATRHVVGVPGLEALQNVLRPFSGNEGFYPLYLVHRIVQQTEAGVRMDGTTDMDGTTPMLGGVFDSGGTFVPHRIPEDHIEIQFVVSDYERNDAVASAAYNARLDLIFDNYLAPLIRKTKPPFFLVDVIFLDFTVEVWRKEGI